MTIKEVSLSEVWQLRQQVMYPHQDIKVVQLDNDADGIHLGAYHEKDLISVISVFCSNKQLQFRKFATRKAFQGRGVGSALLRYVFEWAQENGVELVWCNARLAALGLYKRFGMEAVGDTWIKNGVEYIKMQKKL